MAQTIRLDVEKVVKERLGNKTSRLLIRFLKHIVHEDTFNSFFAAHPNDKNFDFIQAVIGPELLNAQVDIIGKENLKDIDSHILFVSNHPMGGLDGMILALMLGRACNYNIRVLVNDLLMNLTPLKEIFLPVNIYGAQNKEYAQNIEKTYLSDANILTFPAGACSRKINGKIQDMPWKKSFIQKAIEYKRNVVPIYFEGQNSRFFYNLALWRKRLGIKLNIELLFLADEMFKAANSHFKVYIGEPIPYTTFSKSRSANSWSSYVRDIVYHLPEKQINS